MDMSSVASTSPTTCFTPSSRCLEVAKELASQAVEEDSLKNYKAAAHCYREAISLFRRVLGQQHNKRHLEKHPKVKVGVKEKIVLCSERLRILDRYLLEQSDLSPLLKNIVKGGRSNEVLAPVIEEELPDIMKEYVGSRISISGSAHSLYPKCEIKRTTSILSGTSDFGFGEEMIEERKTEEMNPPLADLRNELRLSYSSLSSDEGITTTMRRKKHPESDADAIIVLDEDDDEVRLIETSFEEEKDEEVAYVRVDRIKSTNHGDSASDSGISEERTVISTSDSRNKSPISDCVDDKKGLSYSSSLSGSTYELIQQEILLAETQQPIRERYEYVPPRAFARNKKDKELNGCFYLMACLDAFGVL